MSDPGLDTGTDAGVRSSSLGFCVFLEWCLLPPGILRDICTLDGGKFGGLVHGCRSRRSDLIQEQNKRVNYGVIVGSLGCKLGGAHNTMMV